MCMYIVLKVFLSCWLGGGGVEGGGGGGAARVFLEPWQRLPIQTLRGISQGWLLLPVCLGHEPGA